MKCPACNAWIVGAVPTAARRPFGLSFKIGGCSGCGHIYAENADGTGRDLTRSEAEELRVHEDFTFVRELVENRLMKLGYWG